MDEFGELNDDGTEEDETDRQFWQLTNSLVNPHYNECLVCFLVRAVPSLDPAGFAMTRLFRESNAPRATSLGSRLQQLGIYGDAQLLQEGVVANSSIWEVQRCPDCGIPLGAPDCLGVRRGSTQPCDLWVWRRSAYLKRYEDWLERGF